MILLKIYLTRFDYYIPRKVSFMTTKCGTNGSILIGKTIPRLKPYRSFYLGHKKIEYSVNADIKEVGARPIALRGRRGVPYIDS